MNLLLLANQVIPFQTVQLRQFQSETRNAVGLEVPTYADPVSIEGKINYIRSSLYKKLGLDYKRNYLLFHTIRAVDGISRMNEGDNFDFDNRRWQVESKTGWRPIAGWDAFICVEVTSAS